VKNSCAFSCNLSLKIFAPKIFIEHCKNTGGFLLALKILLKWEQEAKKKGMTK